MHRCTLGWLLITSLWAACAARDSTSGARDAASVSAPATGATGVREPAAVADETARPPPAPVDAPADTPSGAATGASGIRAPPENDAPPRPSGPVRPLQPPPRLDSKRTAPVPPLDRSQNPVQLPPQGPVNEKTPPADR